MTTTPPPPDLGTGGGDDWRNTVLQSYRNDEVREIAKVLAALEPGATTSSKLMLAMRFEDTIFKSATSLADYRKKLTKRLKKLQKNYVPPAEQATSGNDKGALLLQLRQKYTTSLKYIAKNAKKAIEDVSKRLGTEKSIQLQQHTDSAIQWAQELGILHDAPPSSTRLSESQLQKLQQHLERRLENIRQYVVKHADPDLFLQETLERKDKELPARACKLLGVNLSKRVQQLQQTTMSQNKTNGVGKQDPAAEFNAMAMLQESLEKSQVTVPPPTRNNSNDVPAALLHLDKMRSASTALMAYLTIPDRQVTAPRSTLAKTTSVVTEGMDFVRQVTQKLPKPPVGQVTLQDAWTKVLELPPMVDTPTSSNNPVVVDVDGMAPLDATGEGVPNKRVKRNHLPPVIKTQVLLSANRKTPSNLLPALKRKRAKLVRPQAHLSNSTTGHFGGSLGTHITMEFGKAFTMTIYFSPLLVTLRAMDPNGVDKEEEAQRPGAWCAPWTPLYHGLTTTSSESQQRSGDKDEQTGSLQVWGVEGDYDAIGHVVEERLRDASLHATHVLRKCFRNHVQDKTSAFDVEILEATALLEFLHLARTTYMPQWQDDEGVSAG